MSGKRYPEEFKIEAVKQVVDRGHSVSSVATRLGITTHSLYAWIKAYGPDSSTNKVQSDVKVNGRWAYLYRAVDSRGRTVDFYLSSRRNSKAAYRFLGKILNNVKKWQIPRFINTDKAPAYGRALALLKREGRCPSDVEHRQIKYRNNVIECDHGKLKRIIGATLGFKSMKTAYATIKGIEVMRALRKGQASAFYYGDPLGEMRLVSRVFEM
ncbi:MULTISPECIES: IS6 family transposase [Enterobacteriaceae]|uniref:IS6 family transposase n=1 Tax=Enterobacteriaceae TaxID=543 RepID=UPI000CF0BE37|nr:IS6 family transposase [Escherichia coli]PPV95959.1 IS6 family transposase [Escherichia coli]